MSKTVTELKNTLTLREFAGYLEFFKKFKTPIMQADRRAAMIATVTAQSAGNDTKMDDFLPQYDPPKMQSPEMVERMIIAWAKGHNRSLRNGSN